MSTDSDELDVTNFNAYSGQQGRQFESLVEQHVRFWEGWRVLESRALIDPDFPTVDLIVEGPDGQEVWIECKGSYRAEGNNGLERLTTIKVAIGVAYDLHHLRLERELSDGILIPYWIVTSHLPTSPSGKQMLRRAIGAGAVSEIRDVNLRKWDPDE